VAATTSAFSSARISTAGASTVVLPAAPPPSTYARTVSAMVLMAIAAPTDAPSLVAPPPPIVRINGSSIARTRTAVGESTSAPSEMKASTRLETSLAEIDPPMPMPPRNASITCSSAAAAMPR
jgi:hypothetical protein